MSVKLKLFLISILSIFATVGAGFYLTQHQSSVPMVEFNNKQLQQLSAAQPSPELMAFPERSRYKTIPLAKITSVLQGRDPATLALSALDDLGAAVKTRKVEVVYPQRHQALVTITQISLADQKLVDEIKYRVEMTTFGRSLLVSSPPVWQIVWAGSNPNAGL